MKFQVMMLAYQPEFCLRSVDVPDEELAACESNEQKLSLIFKYGQNDFQPNPNICSVSMGDVIQLPNPEAPNGTHDFHLVQSLGFHKMTGVELEDYVDHTDRRDRSFYPLLRQSVEPKIVGYWVLALSGGELMKWGLNGNTVFPYSRIEAAEDQMKYQSETDEYDGIYLERVFDNGQTKHEEYVG